MNRAIAVTLAAVSTLALAACGTPEAKNYTNVAALMNDLQKRDTGWDCTEREYPLVGDSSADCVDSAGGKAFVAVYGNSDDQIKHLDDVRSNTSWHAEIPAMILGKKWHIQCSSVSECETVREHVGGYIVTPPDYTSQELTDDIHEELGIS